MGIKSVYCPYFRGKQYELIVLRETAPILSKSGFVPIIEPVNEQLRGLEKTLIALSHNKTDSVVIVNPQVGFFTSSSQPLINFINNKFPSFEFVNFGFLLTENTKTSDVLNFCKSSKREVTLIHAGFTQSNELSEKLPLLTNIKRNVFFEEKCGKIYQGKFRNTNSNVLLRDGFNKKRNSDYPSSEFFSDLHITFDLEGMQGFGDFLIVGDEFSESGGPAYAIAIHITYIDDSRDNEMHIKHFKSDRQDSPKDPAGKFGEALSKLIFNLNIEGNKILETDAIREFRDFHERSHYPGLGYVKKLSMKHHIEALSDFFEKNGLNE